MERGGWVWRERQPGPLALRSSGRSSVGRRRPSFTGGRLLDAIGCFGCVEVIHGCFYSVVQEMLHGIGGALDRVVDRLPFVATEASQDVVDQVSTARTADADADA